MEWHNWHLGQRARGKDGVFRSPLGWDTFPVLYEKIAEFTNHIPWKRRLILHLFFRGTRIKIDLGDVKAAGVVALLGLSFGLGTLLLYRLYYKYVHNKKLNELKAKEEGDAENDECHVYLESTDRDPSCAKKDMGNVQSSSGVVASVHYSPTYGVAFGPNYNKYRNGRTPLVRNRKSCHQSDGPEFTPVGPTNGDDQALPFEGQEKWCHDARTAKSRSSVSPSMIVNYSPRSVQEKRFDYGHTTKSQSLSEEPSIGKPGDNSILNLDHNLQNSSVLLTPPDDDYVPSFIPFVPSHGPGQTDTQLLPQNLSREQSPASVSELYCTAGSLDYSRYGDGEYEESEHEFGVTSPLPRLSSLDRSFRQNLLVRLREWSTLSQDWSSKSGSGSGSVSPDIRSTPERVIRRSATLGSLGCRSEVESPIAELLEGNDIGLRTSKNLEDIEDEIHQIFCEFDYLNSQISDLKSRSSTTSDRVAPLVPDDPEIMADDSDVDMADNEALQLEIKQAYEHWCQQAQSREHSKSLPPVDSSDMVSSPGTSFIERDLSWDAGDIASNISRHAKYTPGNMAPSVWLAKDSDSVNVVNTLSTMGEVLDDREWEKIAAGTVDRRASLQTDGLDIRMPSREPSPAPGEMSVSANYVSALYEADISNNDCNTSVDGNLSRFTPQKVAVPSIGEKVDMIKYAAKEWKGQTSKSLAIRKGYEATVTRTSRSHMRLVRGDNYCAIRATLYQMLLNGISVKLSSQDTLQKLNKMVEEDVAGICSWNFANRISVTKDSLYQTMSQCLETFFSKFEECQKISSNEERETWVSALFNLSTDTDLHLMEASKLLMLLCAVDLYRDNLEGNDVPTFVWLMFARDTSENPRLFMKNHLNPVGNTGGLEQIEMYLLAYTLGLTIEVYRLCDYGKDDFIATYGGEVSTSSVTLLAEDDRHYNVLVA